MSETKKQDIIEALLRTSRLARLSFDKSRMDTYAKKAKSVIEYVDQLNELKTDGIQPTSHAVSVDAFLRDDVVKAFGSPSEIIGIAPDLDGDFIQVPKVIEGEE
jgi:aspartyl-tRNA(Asn)/glutamyl-tRNA(Gln) amidotransferase subunit C